MPAGLGVDSYNEKSATCRPYRKPFCLSYDVVEYRALDCRAAPAGSQCVGKRVPWEKSNQPYMRLAKPAVAL